MEMTSKVVTQHSPPKPVIDHVEVVTGIADGRMETDCGDRDAEKNSCGDEHPSCEDDCSQTVSTQANYGYPAEILSGAERRETPPDEDCGDETVENCGDENYSPEMTIKAIFNTKSGVGEREMN